MSIDNIHKFGQYIVIQNKNLSKVTDRGYYRQWLGFDNSSKGHITWYHNKITIKHNIQFLDQKPSEIEGDLEESSENDQLVINPSQDKILDNNQQTNNTNRLSMEPQSKRNKTNSPDNHFKRMYAPETLTDNWTSLKLSRNRCVPENSNEGHS